MIIEREKQMPAKAKRVLELQKIVARVEQGLSALEAARLAAKATADAEAALAAATAAETATAAATEYDDDDVASEVGEREGAEEEEEEEEEEELVTVPTLPSERKRPRRWNLHC